MKLQWLRKELNMLLAKMGEGSLSYFRSAISECENNGEDKEKAYEVIRTFLMEVDQVGGDAKKYGTTMAVQARAIEMAWADAPKKDMGLRVIATGKSIEQLEKEDRLSEKKRKKSEAWRAQGLCYNCGGQLGMFKKCKSCGYKN